MEEYLVSGFEPEQVDGFSRGCKLRSIAIASTRTRTYLSFVRFSHSVFALPFALAGALLAARQIADDLGEGGLDSGGDGRGAQRGDGLQPARRRPVRRAQPANRQPRAPPRRDVPREAIAFVVVASAVFVYAAWRLNPLCFALSPVALAIVFWYSLAKRYTTWTQLFLGLAMAVAPVGGWLAVGGRGGVEPWLLALAIGAWVGGFDVLYACQDLDFDRAHGLRSIPVRFGVRSALAISRVMHVVTVVCLLALAWVTPLPVVLFRGRRRRWRALLVYEQSLVRADDLSQVKRAFDLNGYVGILYLLVLAPSVMAR